MAPTRASFDLPSLETLPPDVWVDAMHALRTQVADEAAMILDKNPTAEDALPKLQAIFDVYTAVDINGKSEDRQMGRFYIDITAHDDALVFWVFPTRRYQTIVRTDAGYWWLDQSGADDDGNATYHQYHQAIILRLLEMIPWANDDTIDELAAIETATRAG